ncbi:nucleoside diphosphate kinase [Tilletiaria anomala UBC 951]|uniref:Nucleoside diphosphate kinase n=1 Tax=Tilletiaria anomala (strain ATCC 24038 / CBS 436.72 / UBC 951) TaxID=1037660 RepID=A0A066WAH9_TILAU|nr:nucleoside diphosphate kinase [Tilletiaria anomala UBC 951]KDN49558.1 nucleoside diphosphate kinase [Tilletiaria anomala UBC 951]
MVRAVTVSAATAPPPPSQQQLTLALLKPTLVSYPPDVSAVMKHIQRAQLEIVRTKRLFWKEEDAKAFYAEHEGRFYYDRLIQGMTSGPSIALALAGPDVIKRWRAMLGPTKAYRAKWEQPDCLRAIFGLGDTRNGFHGSDSQDSAIRELNLVFKGWDVERWLEQRSKALP